MTLAHRELAAGRWRELTFLEQMANIGSEVERTIRWKEKGRTEVGVRALERALELLDMTVDDRKNRGRLKELMRVREALADHFSSTTNTLRRTFPGSGTFTLSPGVPGRRPVAEGRVSGRDPTCRGPSGFRLSSINIPPMANPGFYGFGNMRAF